MQAQSDKPHELNLAQKTAAKHDMLIHIGPTSSMLDNPDIGMNLRAAAAGGGNQTILEAGATGSSIKILSDYRNTQGAAQ